MRVLQVHTRYRELGGEDFVVDGERDLLRGAGHEVAVMERWNAASDARAAAQLAASVWNPSATRQLRDAVRGFHPDVVHVHNTWFATSPGVIRAARAAGVNKVVMTLHNYRLMCSNAHLFRDGHVCEDCVGTHPWHGVRHRCYRSSMPASLAAATNIALHRALDTWALVDRFLVPSEFARCRFEAGGLPREKLFVKPHFVEDGPPRPAPPSRSRNIMYVGRLTHEKGVLPLLRAWERAPLRGFELMLVGSGPLDRVARGARDSRVTVAGRLDRDKVRREMTSARALVVPSLSYEGAGEPLAMLEALAAGIPVIASDLGGLPDVPRRLGAQFVAAPGDVAALVRALEALLDSDRVDAAGRLARSIYEREFSPGVGLGCLEGAYALP